MIYLFTVFKCSSVAAVYDRRLYCTGFEACTLKPALTERHIFITPESLLRDNRTATVGVSRFLQHPHKMVRAKPESLRSSPSPAAKLPFASRSFIDPRF